MPIISYKKFLEVFNFMPINSEYEFYFTNTQNTYNVNKYKDEISFARCGYSDEMIKNGWPVDYRCSEEVFYKNFEELYSIKSVDGICLKEEWKNISDIVVNNTFCLANDDINVLFEVYKKFIR